MDPREMQNIIENASLDNEQYGRELYPSHRIVTGRPGVEVDMPGGDSMVHVATQMETLVKATYANFNANITLVDSLIECNRVMISAPNPFANINQIMIRCDQNLTAWTDAFSGNEGLTNADFVLNTPGTGAVYYPLPLIIELPMKRHIFSWSGVYISGSGLYNMYLNFLFLRLGKQ